jgi:hypothetical protein
VWTRRPSLQTGCSLKSSTAVVGAATPKMVAAAGAATETHQTKQTHQRLVLMRHGCFEKPWASTLRSHTGRGVAGTSGSEVPDSYAPRAQPETHSPQISLKRTVAIENERRGKKKLVNPHESNIRHKKEPPETHGSTGRRPSPDRRTTFVGISWCAQASNTRLHVCSHNI